MIRIFFITVMLSSFATEDSLADFDAKSCISITSERVSQYYEGYADRLTNRCDEPVIVFWCLDNPNEKKYLDAACGKAKYYRKAETLKERGDFASNEFSTASDERLVYGACFGKSTSDVRFSGESKYACRIDIDKIVGTGSSRYCGSSLSCASALAEAQSFSLNCADNRKVTGIVETLVRGGTTVARIRSNARSITFATTDKNLKQSVADAVSEMCPLGISASDRTVSTDYLKALVIRPLLAWHLENLTMCKTMAKSTESQSACLQEFRNATQSIRG